MLAEGIRGRRAPLSGPAHHPCTLSPSHPSSRRDMRWPLCTPVSSLGAAGGQGRARLIQNCAPGPRPRPPSRDPSANAVDSEAVSAQVRAEFPCDSSIHTCCPANWPLDLSRHSHCCERHTVPPGRRGLREPAASSILCLPLTPRAGGTHGWSERVSGVALATQAVGTSPMLGGPESLRAKI